MRLLVLLVLLVCAQILLLLLLLLLILLLLMLLQLLLILSNNPIQKISLVFGCVLLAELLFQVINLSLRKKTIMKVYSCRDICYKSKQTGQAQM